MKFVPIKTYTDNLDLKQDWSFSLLFAVFSAYWSVELSKLLIPRLLLKLFFIFFHGKCSIIKITVVMLLVRGLKHAARQGSLCGPRSSKIWGFVLKRLKKGLLCYFLPKMLPTKLYKWRKSIIFGPRDPSSKNGGPQSHFSFNVRHSEHLWYLMRPVRGFEFETPVIGNVIK